ncbi:hypothetical protein GPECTOR_10g1059 [Gonium pectorale]|uniref:cyclin-dependent kinase n=1 Tax=Gonium pectorale TaxID=33097 RepID=A0A150GQ94_GONPE|nr:hypothetical protein GPECTOR_10g1059 [Gonium pectorale]|eukprot:KXZ52036.1 hypothetical protein GPECTOR_10g1059 [Gonium pectorale]
MARAFQALTTSDAAANGVLGSSVNALAQVDKGIAPLLERFGWEAGKGFTTTLDLAGFKIALQRYKYYTLGQLGFGSYGTVSRAVNRETGEVVAIKKVVHSAEGGLSDSTVREVSSLRELSHDNIVSLREIIATVDGTHVYLVLECLDCDLRQFLDCRLGSLDAGTVKSIMFQVLRGVQHFHANSIMHRDLKPHNILIDKDGRRVKITDFGLARCFLPNDGRAYTEQVVTLYYRAPELLAGGRPFYSSAVDMWSVGCIMAELLENSVLFQPNLDGSQGMPDTEIGVLRCMFEKLGTPVDLLTSMPVLAAFPTFQPKPLGQVVPRLAHDAAGLDLLSRLLTYDPRLRITAGQALQHPWFADVQL